MKTVLPPAGTRVELIDFGDSKLKDPLKTADGKYNGRTGKIAETQGSAYIRVYLDEKLPGDTQMPILCTPSELVVSLEQFRGGDHVEVLATGEKGHIIDIVNNKVWVGLHPQDDGTSFQFNQIKLVPPCEDSCCN